MRIITIRLNDVEEQMLNALKKANPKYRDVTKLLLEQIKSDYFKSA